MPWHSPCTHTCFDCVDDLERDTFVHVLFLCGILVGRHRETIPFAVFRNRQVLLALAGSVLLHFKSYSKIAQLTSLFYNLHRFSCLCSYPPMHLSEGHLAP